MTLLILLLRFRPSRHLLGLRLSPAQIRLRAHVRIVHLRSLLRALLLIILGTAGDQLDQTLDVDVALAVDGRL